MASVTLNKLWLHDGGDLSDNIRVYYDPDEQVTPSRRTEVRTYAGGRQRAVTGPARPVTASWAARALTLEDLDWIEERLGRLLLVRSPSGRNVWGVIAELPYSHARNARHFDVDITVREVTYDEAV